MKLKVKVDKLKSEKSEFAYEKEQLVQQVHKLELRLKQAQVILNFGDNENDRSKSRTAGSILEEDTGRSALKS